MSYSLRYVVGTIAGLVVAVVAYGIVDTGSTSQRILDPHSNNQHSSTERPRCPTQPPELHVGNDWVRTSCSIHRKSVDEQNVMDDLEYREIAYNRLAGAVQIVCPLDLSQELMI
jgi:hypothetical protein